MGSYLVTGAAGFIGSQLAKKLLAEGHEVVGLDNLSTGYRANVPKGVILLEGDCQDLRMIDQLRRYQFEAIYHIAGQSSGEISFDDPIYDLQTNTQSTLLLLKLALDTGCRKFIYASSMSVYGDTDVLPVTEKVEPRPKSFYAVGKLASEHYLRIYAELGLATAALRLFNVYGPGQNLANLRQGMVSIFLAQGLKNKHIHVKGSAERFRDFVYIDDVLAAFGKTEQNIRPGEYYQFNLCSGKKTTVGELVDIIVELIGEPVSIQFEGSTPGDQFGVFGDNRLARDLIDWQPRISFRKGMEQMTDWAKSKVF